MYNLVKLEVDRLICRVPIANFQAGISVIGTETVGIFKERVGWGTGNFKRIFNILRIQMFYFAIFSEITRRLVER